MSLTFRCHTLRPERSSGWLAFFELVTTSEKGGRFLIVGPRQRPEPHEIEAILTAGQAAVRYFKETPETAPPATLLEGIARLLSHEAEASGTPLQFGCGVLERGRLVFLTDGEVRLVKMSSASDPVLEAPKVDQIEVRPDQRFFFGRIPTNLSGLHDISAYISGLEQGGGGDGGLVLSFADQEKGGSSGSRPVFGLNEADPRVITTSMASPATKGEPSSSIEPHSQAQADRPTADLPGIGNDAPGQEETAPEAPPVQVSINLNQPAIGGDPESIEIQPAVAEPAQPQIPVGKDPADGTTESLPVPAGEAPISGFSDSEDTRGLGFWLGVVSSIVVIGALLGYIFIWRGDVKEALVPDQTHEPAQPTAEEIVQDTRINGTTPLTIDKLWTVQLDKPVTSTATTAGDGVVFGCRDGRVYCLEKNTGSRLWAYAADKGFGSSPAVAGEVVVIGGYDGIVYGLDLNTGQEKWNTPTNGKIVASPAIQDQFVYIGSYDHRVYGLDLNTGRIHWRQDLGDVVWASPHVAGDAVIAAGLDGRVWAFDRLSGRRLWQTATGGQIYSSPTSGERKVFLGSKDKHVYALDLENGETVWKVAASSEILGSPVYHEGRVIIGTEDGTVLGIDAGLGTVVWTLKSEGPVRGRPLIADDLVWFTSYDGRLRAAAWLLGEEVAVYEIGSAAFASPWILDNHVFFGDMAGAFHAVAYSSPR